MKLETSGLALAVMDFMALLFSGGILTHLGGACGEKKSWETGFPPTPTTLYQHPMTNRSPKLEGCWEGPWRRPGRSRVLAEK